MPPSSEGGNSSSLYASQGVDELATLDSYHHFHGNSGLCAWLVFPSSIGCLEFSDPPEGALDLVTNRQGAI